MSKSNTLTIQDTLTKINTEARAKAVHETRKIQIMPIGKVARQGDIYVHRVADDHAHGTKMETNQLVRGVTMGSRHVASKGVTCFEGTKAPEWAPRAILGPCIESPKRFKIEHPEHAWLDLPAGRYQVTLQMDARTLQAVRD